ncbi:hypothetical protein ACIQXQ_18635 [Peribacillus sp. NPDC097198]|uniref:hypothetical protein n=1 Tax=Peribacillus sp. NPDC097198 TaxID=3364397 RepID=UPI003812889C
MSNNQKLFLILTLIPLVIALVIVFNTDFLIPVGYELGVNGVVISRNLYVLFILYLITKIDFYFAEKKKD